MNSNNVAQLIPTAQEALRGFLSAILGQEAPLTIDPPGETSFADARAQAAAYHKVTAEGPGLRYAILLDDKWLPLLSHAMLGEAIEAEGQAGEDFLREIAGQAYGSVRSTLVESGKALPEVSFKAYTSGDAIPDGALDDDLLKVSFGLNVDGQSLGGFALLPAVYEAVEAPPAPDVPRARAAAPAPVAPPLGGTASPVDVAPIAYPDLGAEHIRGDGGNVGFGMLADVELEVTVELGRRKLPLSDLLRLTTGSVVELEKLVGEPLEVYANGRFIAEGEAVVVDEQFGIRITSLAAARQRSKAFV
ncbi:MAG TPA: flagellar motor switch protein FliN [Rhodothermales bacterium]|nr:flagellar motor switch protein FliN [Rhodothermales bacterium]